MTPPNIVDKYSMKTQIKPSVFYLVLTGFTALSLFIISAITNSTPKEIGKLATAGFLEQPILSFFSTIVFACIVITIIDCVRMLRDKEGVERAREQVRKDYENGTLY